MAPEQFDRAVFEAMAPLVQERVKVLAEVPAYGRLPVPRRTDIDDPTSWAKAMKAPPRRDGARRVIAAYADVPSGRPTALKADARGASARARA